MGIELGVSRVQKSLTGQPKGRKPPPLAVTLCIFQNLVSPGHLQNVGTYYITPTMNDQINAIFQEYISILLI